MSTPRRHVLFVSVPHMSHITSLLNLARKVVVYHDVTFIVSHIRVQHLRDRGIFSKEDEKNIYLVGLRDGTTEEDTKDMSFPGMMATFQKTLGPLNAMYETLPVPGKPGIGEQTSTVDREISRPINVLIGDLGVAVQAVNMAARGVRVIAFVATAGFVVSNKINIDELTPVIPDEDFFSDWEAHADVSRTGAPAQIKAQMMDSLAMGRNPFEILSALAFNSVAELEPDCAKIIRASPYCDKIPTRFLAPLFDEKVSRDQTTNESSLLAWLNKQDERSVVYITFGSMAVSVKKQVEEIAKALLSLGRPFIWGLRKEEHEFLPEDVKSLITDQLIRPDTTFLVLPWAPQRTILNHSATAVFLTHAGWNSYLESVDAGVPMVAWPMFGDHFGIANMLVQAGAGIKIHDTSMLFKRTVSAEEIAESINTVGGWKENGEETDDFLRNAEKVGKIIREASQPGGSSHQALLDLVNIDIGGLEAYQK